MTHRSLLLFSLVPLWGCPAPGPGSTTAVVGADGGRVEVEGAYVDIPAGALSEDVEIRVWADGDAPDPEALGELMVFEPHGTTFAEPVTVGMEASADAVIMWSEDGENFTTVPTTMQDGFATTTTTSFSWGYPAPAGGGASPFPCTDCLLQSVEPATQFDWTTEVDEPQCVTGILEFDDGGTSSAFYVGIVPCAGTAPQLELERRWSFADVGGGRVAITDGVGACLTVVHDTASDYRDVDVFPCDIPDEPPLLAISDFAWTVQPDGSGSLGTTEGECLGFQEQGGGFVDGDSLTTFDCSLQGTNDVYTHWNVVP